MTASLLYAAAVCLSSLVGCPTAVALQADASESPVSQSPASRTDLHVLINEHCLQCHGAQSAEGTVRLDMLTTDSTDSATLSLWERVHDRLVAGTMPPASEIPPPQSLLQTSISQLHQRLTNASRQRQQAEGRVLLRRLTAVEYEQALHDLLGIHLPLKDLLPEDSPTAGFDNNSRGLDLSATHFLRYQEAAAKAIAAVVPISPPIPFTETRTGLQITQKGPNFREGLGRTCRLIDESLIFYTRLPRYGLCATPAVATAGRYRIQLQACAVGEGVQSIPVGLMKVQQSGREGPELYDVVDIPAGDPAVIELECELESRQAFVINLLTHWDIRRFRKPIEEYTGPGLRVDWLRIEGPLDEFPPPRYTRLFDTTPLVARSVVQARAAGRRIPVISEQRQPQQWDADPLWPDSASPREDAARLISDFLPRAFRRPVSDEEQQHFVGATLKQLDEGATFYEAMQYGLQLILTSPPFLFLLDTPPGIPLDDYALASRLSFFLWSSIPDAELLSVAERGELTRTEVLHAQLERMLQAPESEALIRHFAGQWLDLHRLQATIPDPVLYSEFDPLLLWSMQQETELFFKEVLTHNLSLLNFADSDWSMLNERLGRHYGIPGLQGSQLTRVALPADSQRGGVLTQASVLKVTADGTRTSPVLRGAWVLDRILGTPPQPPPPGIPVIEPDIRGTTTIRQQLQAHRNAAACALCHHQIDPPGFALEAFDPIGNLRTFYRVTTRTPAGVVEIPSGSGRPVYRGPDVEVGGVLADGRAFADVREFRSMLLVQKDQLARNLIHRMVLYATGAEIQFADREVVETILDRVRQQNYGLRTLIHEVVGSRLFLLK